MGIDREIEQGEREGRLHRGLQRFKAFTGRHPLLRFVYKSVVTVIGGTIVLAGLVMLVTPGPGWLAIFLGLGILATEYPLIHRFNQWAKAAVVRAWRRLRQRRAERLERRAARRKKRAQARVAQKQRRELLEAQFRRSHNCAPHRPLKAPKPVVPRSRSRVAYGRRLPEV